MMITAEGWRRRVDLTMLLRGHLSDATRLLDDEPLNPDTLYLRHRADGDVEIVGRSAQHLRLGGRYRVTVQLTRGDIANLFYATHGTDIVQVFRKMVEKAEGEAKQTLKRARGRTK